MNTIIFEVEGMVCDGCAANVHRTISQVRGIVSCDVSYPSQEAIIQYHPQQVNVATIAKEVEEVGFTVTVKK